MSIDAKRRDPEATRNAILSAAGDLFVERGFAATSMTDVASRAGVTKSLIHHHFHSKEDLWREIMRARTDDWVAAQEQLIAGEELEGLALMRRALERRFELLRNNPDLVRLAAWSGLEDPLRSHAVHPELFVHSIERLRREQERGTLRSDIQPVHIVAMFVALSQHWFFSKKGELGAVTGPSEADAAYLVDMLQVFLAGLSPAAAPPRDGKGAGS